MHQEIDVKAMRTRLGLSQKKFAELFGVDQSTVSEWETKGAPKRGTARKLLLIFAAGGVVLVKGKAA